MTKTTDERKDFARGNEYRAHARKKRDESVSEVFDSLKEYNPELVFGKIHIDADKILTPENTGFPYVTYSGVIFALMGTEVGTLAGVKKFYKSKKVMDNILGAQEKLLKISKNYIEASNEIDSITLN